jgi:hypothetical protein
MPPRAMRFEGVLGDRFETPIRHDRIYRILIGCFPETAITEKTLTKTGLIMLLIGRDYFPFPAESRLKRLVSGFCFVNQSFAAKLKTERSGEN